MSSPTIWYIGGDDVRLRIPLLLALRDRGFQVGAVGSENGAAFRHNDIPYWRYSLDRWINPIADVRSVIELYRLLQRFKPDIVHAFDTKPAIFVPLVARKAAVLGRARTVTGMGFLFSSSSLLATGLQPVYRVLQRWAGYSAGVTIFQNPDDQHYFLRHNMVAQGHDALVMGSGIDIEGVLGQLPTNEALQQLRRSLQLDGKLVVTMVARMVKHKGVLEYIRAGEIVQQRLSNVIFLLVGPQTSEGRQAVSQKALAEGAKFVRYLGPRNDVPALLALTDIFALPSYYREGIPRVLLEAAALGLPLVTTDMPGCKEVVRDGWNGLLVPPQNAEALAEAILTLLASTEARVAMGCRSKAFIDKFSLRLVADQYAEIYKRMLAEKNYSRQ